MKKEEICKIISLKIQELEGIENKYEEKLFNPLDEIKKELQTVKDKKEQLTSFLQHFDPERINKAWCVCSESRREQDTLIYNLPYNYQTEIHIALSEGCVCITQKGERVGKMQAEIWGVNEIQYKENLQKVIFIRRGEYEAFMGIDSNGCCDIHIGT